MKFQKCMKFLCELNKFDTVIVRVSDCDRNFECDIDDIKLCDIMSFNDKDFDMMIDEHINDKIVFSLHEK